MRAFESVIPMKLAAALLAVFAAPGPAAFAQQTEQLRPSRCVLLSESLLTDDCPICGRPVIPEPMRGSFNLRLLENNVLYSRYAVENINFKAGGDGRYTVKGSGTYQVGGEVAVIQQIALNVEIDDGTTKKVCEFSGSSSSTRSWPMIDISVDQTNGTLIQTYHLRIAAAPVRDVWFSTASFFTAGAGENATQVVLSGDLISTSGRVVKTNRFFYTSVGATPPGPNLGLDAIDVLPGGEFAFSLDAGFPTSNIGPLQPGDILSTRGHMIRRNQTLLAPFGIMPVVPDTGLDAVHILDSGEILFSIESNHFSERLGVTLHRGDLLSSTGRIARHYQEFLSSFDPPAPATDYGLDALYLWPGGETWFSTEQGFTDLQLGPILAGDLLSDRGYIVFRNADLVSAFAPVQTTPDFGLDALFIVTDATPPPPAPAGFTLTADPGTGHITLFWGSQARAFQVERSTSPAGPFQPISPIIPDLTFEEPVDLTAPRAFYRLLQW